MKAKYACVTSKVTKILYIHKSVAYIIKSEYLILDSKDVCVCACARELMTSIYRSNDKPSVQMVKYSDV